MPARRPAAVLFDMDGTLVDSERLWDVALQEFAANAGGILSPVARAAIVGSEWSRTMRLLYDDLQLAGRDTAADIAWIDQRVHQLFSAGLLTWRPGARELLATVRAAELPTALVTSTTRGLVEVVLDTLGRDNFDVVVCGDEVAAAKPDPEPYLRAAKLLGVPIGDCVAVEDSPPGLASAAASGAAVLAVPSEVPLPATAGARLRDTLVGVDVEYLADLLFTVRP